MNIICELTEPGDRFAFDTAACDAAAVAYQRVRRDLEAEGIKVDNTSFDVALAAAIYGLMRLARANRKDFNTALQDARQMMGKCGTTWPYKVNVSGIVQ